MGEQLDAFGFPLPDEITADLGHGPRFRWPRHGVCDRCHRIQPALYRRFDGEAVCFACLRDIVDSRRFLRGRRDEIPPLRPFDYEWWNSHFAPVPG